MAVAALVLGILGFVAFSWAGPVGGSLLAGAMMGTAAFGGHPALVTWPIWVLGLVVGVGFPLVAVVLGAVALKKEEAKGVAIGGLVAGALGAVGGLIITVALYFTVTAGAAILDKADVATDVMGDPAFQQGMQQLQDQLNDPKFQQQIQQAMDRAAKQLNQAPQPAQPVPGQPGQPLPAEQPPAGQPPQPAAPPTQPQPIQPVPVQPAPAGQPAR